MKKRNKLLWLISFLAQKDTAEFKFSCKLSKYFTAWFHTNTNETQDGIAARLKLATPRSFVLTLRTKSTTLCEAYPVYANSTSRNNFAIENFNERRVDNWKYNDFLVNPGTVYHVILRSIEFVNGFNAAAITALIFPTRSPFQEQ